MKKVLDTSAISSITRDITCVDLYSVISGRYSVVTPASVKREFDDYKGDVVASTDRFQVYDKDSEVLSISSMIKAHRDTLGEGECAAIAISLSLTANGVPNYVVLDDKTARNVAKVAGAFQDVVDVLGKEVEINVTGTIGLILHLYELGLITDEIRRDIGSDLENSTFRMTDSLAELLR